MHTVGKSSVRVLVKIGSGWYVPSPLDSELVNYLTNNRCEKEMESFSTVSEVERGEEKKYFGRCVRSARFSSQYLFKN